jgi:monoamine oxidase
MGRTPLFRRLMSNLLGADTPPPRSHGMSRRDLVQSDTNTFLDELDVVHPGIKARARTNARGAYVCHLEHWPTNPFAQGGYTANQPGYFTELAGHEATPVGNLYFAGETTDSFYSWQGFMEGAALSGLRVAGEISSDF